jgi:hypothetical protein
MQKQEVFRLTTGSFQTKLEKFVPFTGCSGQLVVPSLVGGQERVQYILSIGGHFVDGDPAFVDFRIKLTPKCTTDVPMPTPVYYIPDDKGMRKYLYVQHSRLESVTFMGVSAFPIGTMMAELEICCRADGQETSTYNWHSDYGQISLVIS